MSVGGDDQDEAGHACHPNKIGPGGGTVAKVPLVRRPQGVAGLQRALSGGVFGPVGGGQFAQDADTSVAFLPPQRRKQEFVQHFEGTPAVKDLVEVKAAADVARDPAERVRPLDGRPEAT